MVILAFSYPGEIIENCVCISSTWFSGFHQRNSNALWKGRRCTLCEWIFLFVNLKYIWEIQKLWNMEHSSERKSPTWWCVPMWTTTAKLITWNLLNDSTIPPEISVNAFDINYFIWRILRSFIEIVSDKINWLIPGFNFAVLLVNLKEHITNDPRLDKIIGQAKTLLEYFDQVRNILFLKKISQQRLSFLMEIILYFEESLMH